MVLIEISVNDAGMKKVANEIENELKGKTKIVLKEISNSREHITMLVDIEEIKIPQSECCKVTNIENSDYGMLKDYFFKNFSASSTPSNKK